MPELATPDAADAADLYQQGDDSRRYRAMYGKRTVRLAQLLLVPRTGDYDRVLPSADLRLMEMRKDGGELRLEYSATLAVLTGERLRIVASAIAGGWCASVTAYDPQRHDAPDDPAAPVVREIAFYMRGDRTGERQAE